ncbi:MAG: DUF3280 domain-containing protein [Pseudomonadota bacterium]
MAADLKPGATVAFFGIHFIDTSTEGAYNGVREDEVARMDMITEYVRGQFAEKGFDLVDISPVQQDLDRIVNVADCNYCDVLMARELGTDYALVGEVQKVSNLILAMNLVVRETETGQVAKGLAVDIRGNTDKSWLRGIRYILKNNIFRKK